MNIQPSSKNRAKTFISTLKYLSLYNSLKE